MSSSSLSMLEKYMPRVSAVLMNKLLTSDSDVKKTVCFYGRGSNGKTTLSTFLRNTYPNFITTTPVTENFTYFYENNLWLGEANGKCDVEQIKKLAEDSGSEFLCINFPITF
jgi:hypothetical protein